MRRAFESECALTHPHSILTAGTANLTVVHKTGPSDLTENDTALVLGAPSGAYVVTVLTDGLDETGGTALIASIAAAFESFETAR